jgi:two-component system, chemotaxis family, protein-glutamate methylesterase/glutaminase
MQTAGLLPTGPPPTRDIVVIGASAGGLEVLQRLLAELPRDLPASLFIVVHIGEVSILARILGRASVIPVTEGRSGELPVRGRAYVAVPGKHLLLHDDHMLSRRGPRENLARPAIDPLFRSAAATYGPRVIGLVLSGSLSDGTAGLRAIKRCGGLALVQDPRDALVPSMPESAIRHADVDEVLPSHEIAARLSVLVRQPAPPAPEVPLEVRLEAAIAAQELADMKIDDRLGSPSRFTCPECHGALWEVEDGSLLRYRCHVGHAYTDDTMLASQTEAIDRLLGTLLRSHQERAALAQRMSDNERLQGREDLADRLSLRAVDYDRDAQLMKRLLRNGNDDDEVVTNSELRSALEHERG